MPWPPRLPLARYGSKVIAEMGGKDAIIVADDGNIKEAAAAITASALDSRAKVFSARAILMPLFTTMMQRWLRRLRS